MTQAQVAWAVFSILWLVAAVLLFLLSDLVIPGGLCLGVAFVGWVALGGMLLSDRKT